jgi:hypothetical protein
MAKRVETWRGQMHFFLREAEHELCRVCSDGLNVLWWDDQEWTRLKLSGNLRPIEYRRKAVRTSATIRVHNSASYRYEHETTWHGGANLFNLLGTLPHYTRHAQQLPKHMQVSTAGMDTVLGSQCHVMHEMRMYLAFPLVWTCVVLVARMSRRMRQPLVRTGRSRFHEYELLV